MTPSKPPKILIIIINWNNSKDTLACLKSLQQIDYPNYKLLVIDNASTDGSAATIRSAYPDVQLIENDENLGFVGGNNQGLEIAQQEGMDYALLLNNDTEVASDFLSELVQVAESDPQIGIVGPTIHYFDPPWTLWSIGGEINWQHGNTNMLGIGEEQCGQYGESAHSVDFVTGCALLIKMSVVAKINGLEPRFFLYYEEVEWCVRATRAGYRIMHVPTSKVWHKISPQAREDSPKVHYYMTRNRLLFLKITQAGWQAWASTLVEYVRTLLSWTIKPKWQHKTAQRRAMTQAIRDFWRGRFGKTENIL